MEGRLPADTTSIPPFRYLYAKYDGDPAQQKVGRPLPPPATATAAVEMTPRHPSPVPAMCSCTCGTPRSGYFAQSTA